MAQLRHWIPITGWMAPSLLCAGSALLFALIAPAAVPMWMRIVLFGSAALMLPLNLIQIRRSLAQLQDLEDGLRNMAEGRLDTPLPPNLPPGLFETVEQLELIRSQMLGYRDQLEQRIQGAAERLRQDLEGARHELRVAKQNLGGVQNEFRQQSELFSGLTHELRTPLTAILGFSDLLRKTRLNEHQDDYLETLDRSARGLLSMLNDVLDWSRIDAGRLALNIESFNVADAVEDVVAMLAPLAYEKQLELVHVVHHDVPVLIDGDAQRLRQILTNLLSNAIKFTDQGEVVLRVIRERQQGTRLWLRASVSDSGVGLTERQRMRLFQPFEQLQPANRRQPGTGLGLTIVKRLVDLMSGTISVDSAPGRGSTFTVVVEVASASAALLAPDETPLRARRVWLWEPQREARQALLHWLQFWKLDVRVFDNPAPLLEQLRSAPPELVIAGLKPRDLQLDSVRALGNQCMEAQPPLLALLTSAASIDQQQAIDLGAARALPKSVGRLQLYRELCELLSRDVARPLLDGRRLMIVDNSVANRRYLAALARGLGAQIIEAQDGCEAIGLWRSSPCEFALIDYRMPRLDGLELIRLLRAEAAPGIARARLVATSAYLAADERRALREAGADDVLIKPFDEAQLLRALLSPAAAGAEPVVASAPAARASRLAQDQQLLDLLRQELPLQFQELDDAFQRGDAAAARAAAHTLNGTAAFYQLQGLKSVASEAEERLATSAFSQFGHGDLQRVRKVLDETLGGIAPDRSPASSATLASDADTQRGAAASPFF